MPPTKKENILENIEGIEISDPYRWLENANDPQVKEWIAAQNVHAHTVLKNKYFQGFSDTLAKNFKITNFSNPIPVKGKYFYTERQPDQDQAVLYMKKGLDGTPVVLFDPNGKREDNTVNIDYWSESNSGRYIAYGISEGGNEMATLFIKDTETNKDLSENIPHCRYSDIRWRPDDSGFFYTRNPMPGTVPKNEEHLHAKVYFHKLGDNPDNDELIFGKDRSKEDSMGLTHSTGGRYLGISVSRNWSENEIHIYDCDTKEILPLVTGIPSKFSVFLLKDKILLKTNYKANNFRVIVSSYENMHQPIDAWKEFVPERESILETVRLTQSKILVGYLKNACSEVVIFDYEGKQVGSLPLPPFSNLAGISSRRTEEEFFYGVESFLFPKVLYRYDPETQTYGQYRKVENPINPDDYTVVREWYATKDGTRVPVFIYHRKGLELNGKNPTILFGYGGFSINKTPEFNRNWVPWIAQGGVYAVANIRGGGEFGEAWHKGGIKENKQNSFDDFIAAAEYIIARGYTSSRNLGILGGSNGGLLVAAVAVQRPELCKAVCSRVPLTDMVRFPKFGIAVRWVHEYGNPAVKEDLKRILTWSPYHNVKEDVDYPHILFTTAEKDTRVDPLHARKMAARLQEVEAADNKTLIITETEAGHGPGKPIAKTVEIQAYVLSFFTELLK